MNIINCKVNLNNYSYKIDFNNPLNNNFYNLFIERTHNFTFDKKSFHFNNENGILCAILGQIFNLEAIKSKYKIDSCLDVEII